MNDKFAAQDALRLGVPAALEAARFPEPSHLRGETLDDRAKVFLLIRQRFFLGNL